MLILLMYEPSAPHLAALKEAAPAATFRWAGSEAEAQALVADAEAILGNRYFLQSLPYARRLRWMQSNSVGVDLVLSQPALTQGLTITNVRGVYDDELADHALALLLGVVRGLHHARDAQRERVWRREPLRTLAGTAALILGWGGVGRGIAKRLLPFGVAMTAARRTHPGPPYTEGGVLLCGSDGWRERLPATDWLILALPLTAQTRGMVGAAELAALRPGAVVVNLSRGAILDEAALFDLLSAGALAGAALDVLTDEPPPPTHPAFSTPNVLLTPHVGRSSQAGPPRWEPLFVENVRRFAAGLPLLNVVDPEQGY
jgi:phosphoglycerate dehydrogenase-like enzyme